MARTKSSKSAAGNSANIGLEAQHWLAAEHFYFLLSPLAFLSRLPSRGNANFAWVQHFIHHLAPHGMAGFVLVRFWFWVKHRCLRANSREETGNALCAFNEDYRALCSMAV